MEQQSKAPMNLDVCKITVCLFGNLGRMTTKILKPPEMRFVVVHLVAMNRTHESTG